MLCGKFSECPAGYECGMYMKNPNLETTNFDNIFSALLTIFQCVTLEGWSLVMLMEMETSHSMTCLFFIPLVFIGAYFMLNLTLAVISYKFNEAHKYYAEKKKREMIKKQKMIDNGGIDAVQNMRTVSE